MAVVMAVIIASAIVVVLVRYPHVLRKLHLLYGSRWNISMLFKWWYGRVTAYRKTPDWGDSEP